MKHLKLIITGIFLVSLLSIGNVAANGVNSSNIIRLDLMSSFVGEACSGLNQIQSGASCNATGKNNVVKSLASKVVNILSLIIGIASVIMIIISGLRFVFSNGDSNSVSSARNTLIYALVGLAIAVLAQIIVHLVLNTANNVNNSASYLNQSLIIKKDA